MTDVNVNQVIGMFESVFEQEDKINALKGQIKMITADNNEQFKEFASSIETKPAQLKKAYKHWKEVQASDNPEQESDDFFTLAALIDIALQKEKDEEED